MVAYPSVTVKQAHARASLEKFSQKYFVIDFVMMIKKKVCAN
jgi:hypothetical protein